MELHCLLSALAVLSYLAYAQPPENKYAISTFENSGSLAQWHVSGSGSLELGTGYRGSGAVLTYQIRADAPVVIAWHSNGRVPKLKGASLSVWVRFSYDVSVTLESTDASGNARLVPIEASLEHPRAGEWQYAVGQLEKGAAALAFIIRSRTGEPVTGRFYFDEIMLSKDSKVFRLPADQESSVSVRNAKELPILGVNIHLLKDERSLDLARAAGFRFARMDLLWGNVERHGRYRFLAYDLLLRDLEARGMGVLWILDYGHPDHGGDVPRSADDIAAFSHFAEAAAGHYRGRNVRFEIWNEPNNPQFWAHSPNPTEYAALLRAALTAMHRADPSVIVSSGGVSNLDLSFLSHALDRTFNPMLRAISVHPYPRDNPEAIAPAYAAVRNWASKELGEAVEVWDSEWGYSSALPGSRSAQNGHNDPDRHRQATLAVREILSVWSLGFDLGVWYDLRDDGQDSSNPEQNYGLLDSEGREKPAMRAVQKLIVTATARKFTGMILKAPPGVHAMRFAGAHDELLIVWTEVSGKSERVECNRKDFIEATDMMGNALETKSASKDQLRIRFSESAGPIYLLLKTGSQL